MIDSLPPRSVVWVRNGEPRVFDRREGDIMVFYYPDISQRDIVELQTPRSYVNNIGNMVNFEFTSRSKRRDLTPRDGDYYLERRNDLVALGLMGEK